MPDAALYDLADRLYQLAPWKWMHEQQLIFLRHPETGEQAFISIMGQNGEHLCMALYLGEQALHRFNLMQQAESEGIPLFPEDDMALILETRQVQVFFDRRAELFPHELREIKALGRKYRGGNWPGFRSFRPGHAPGPIDTAEEEWVRHAIGQTLELAPGFEDDPAGEYRNGKNGTEWLTREMVDGEWTTTWTPRDDRLYRFPEPSPSEVLAAKVKTHPAAGDFECTFQLIPSPMGRDSTSRIFPYILACVDSESGFVLGLKCLGVEDQSHQEMIASVPDSFLRMWDRHKVRPASIRVGSQVSGGLLRETAGALGVPIRLAPELPALDEALASALGALGIGPPAGG